MSIIKEEQRNGWYYIYGDGDIVVERDFETKQGIKHLSLNIPYNHNDTDYFDFNKHITGSNPWVRYIIAIMFNGTGKTYSMYKICIKEILKGNPVIWGRLTQLQSMTAVQGWQSALHSNSELVKQMVKDGEITEEESKDIDNYKCDTKGVYRMNKVITGKKKVQVKPYHWEEVGEDIVKTEKGDYICPFVYISSIGNSCPQVENCAVYVVDEILTGDEQRQVKVDDFRYQWETLIKRTGRGNSIEPIRNYFIANPHNLESDVLSAYNIDSNWDETFKGHWCIGYKNGYLYYVDPRNWDYLKTNLRLRQLDADCDELDKPSVYSCKFKPESCKNIVPTWLDEKVWLYNIQLTDEDVFAVFGVEKDSLVYCWIAKLWRFKEYCNGTTYSIKASANSKNSVTLNGNENIINAIPQLVNCVVLGTLYYDSPYTKDTCKDLASLFNEYKKAIEDGNK